MSSTAVISERAMLSLALQRASTLALAQSPVHGTRMTAWPCARNLAELQRRTSIDAPDGARLACSGMIADRWDEALAARLDEAGRLVYRSNLLGSDPAITNFGGGNTSAKLDALDPLTGERASVLWVKGSGGDLGTIRENGFATLYQERLLALEKVYRGLEREDEMVAHLARCAFDPQGRAPSIDTPLHAFVPHAHVDHVHPDAVIAIAAARRGAQLTEEIFGGEVGWIPWQRPGFDLGLRLRGALREHPRWRGVVLGGHGLITWGPDSRSCYENTLAVVRRAEEGLARKARQPAFGAVVTPALAPAERQAAAARLMPLVRGRLSGARTKVGHFSDAPEVLELVGSARLEQLARLGTSCPDHFLRTKIRPLVLPPEGASFEAELDARLGAYREDYAAYYQRWREDDSPALRDSDPVVFLAPGLGLWTFAADKATARIAAEFYTNAVNVMRGASGVDEYVGLDEREAFRVEYWKLEQAKLDRMPPPRELAGKVALITGGAGGIGRATAERLLRDGACVCLVDIDRAALDAAAAALAPGSADRERLQTVTADVTSEDAVERAFAAAAREFGGLDVVVANTGIASAAPVEATTLEQWNQSLGVLATGYFLVARSAFRLLRRQGLGGSIVFVGSKNALAASAGASAYSSAKAAALHLARCLALEGAEAGIRVNVVNPDAVLDGSRIWQGEWRTSRAAAYGVRPEELEEFYRKRSLLKRSVAPRDVAEAVHFFASDRSSRSTGNVLNVDAGNVTAFPR
jgi:rhamnulose-1-phosphate aldolase/alcohol dehydrogenase